MPRVNQVGIGLMLNVQLQIIVFQAFYTIDLKRLSYEDITSRRSDFAKFPRKT